MAEVANRMVGKAGEGSQECHIDRQGSGSLYCRAHVRVDVAGIGSEHHREVAVHLFVVIQEADHASIIVPPLRLDAQVSTAEVSATYISGYYFPCRVTCGNFYSC